MCPRIAECLFSCVIELINSIADVVTAEDMIYQNIMSEDGLRARALYDYQAGNKMVFIDT